MKKVISVLFVMVFVFTAISPIMAHASTDPAKDVATYTGNVVTGSAKTVGEATEGTAKTAASPFVSFWNFLTGKGKGEKVVTEPVDKAGKTTYDAAVNTGRTIVGDK